MGRCDNYAMSWSQNNSIFKKSKYKKLKIFRLYTLRKFKTFFFPKIAILSKMQYFFKNINVIIIPLLTVS